MSQVLISPLLDSGGASPVAGNENGTTEPTVSPAEVPRSTDASDGKLDQEMIDIGNVRADGSTEKSVAGQSRPDETVDVDMDLGNDRFVVPKPFLCLA